MREQTGSILACSTGHGPPRQREPGVPEGLAAMNGCFESSLDHLFAELRRLELRLRLEVRKARQKDANGGDDRFRGLYVSDREVEAILDGSSAVDDGPDTTAEGPAGKDALAAPLEQLGPTIRRKKEESRRRGRGVRL